MSTDSELIAYLEERRRRRNNIIGVLLALALVTFVGVSVMRSQQASDRYDERRVEQFREAMNP